MLDFLIKFKNLGRINFGLILEKYFFLNCLRIGIVFFMFFKVENGKIRRFLVLVSVVVKVVKN